MKVFNDTNPFQLRGAVILSLFGLLQSIFAQAVSPPANSFAPAVYPQTKIYAPAQPPANFRIDKVEVYEYSKRETTNSSRIYMDDFLTVKLHWTLYNATYNQYIRLGIDPALQIVPIRKLDIIGSNANQKPLRVAQCSLYDMIVRGPKNSRTYKVVILGRLNMVDQSTLDEYGTISGVLRLSAILNPRVIKKERSRKFEVASANFGQISFLSEEVTIIRPQLQRSCTWIPVPDGARTLFFTCTLTLPTGYQWSKLVLSDEIVRGNATFVSATFIEEDIANQHKPKLVSLSLYDENTSKNYELRMRSLTLDGSRNRYHLEITYQSHPDPDKPRSFVGIAKVTSTHYRFHRESYLHPYTARIPLITQEELLNQTKWAPSEHLPIPAYIIMDADHEGLAPRPLLVGPEDQSNGTNNSIPVGSAEEHLQNSKSKHTFSPLYHHVDIITLHESTNETKATDSSRNELHTDSITTPFTEKTFTVNTTTRDVEPPHSVLPIPGFLTSNQTAYNPSLQNAEERINMINTMLPISGANETRTMKETIESTTSVNSGSGVRNTHHSSDLFVLSPTTRFHSGTTPNSDFPSTNFGAPTLSVFAHSTDSANYPLHIPSSKWISSLTAQPSPGPVGLPISTSTSLHFESRSAKQSIYDPQSQKLDSIASQSTGSGTSESFEAMFETARSEETPAYLEKIGHSSDTTTKSSCGIAHRETLVITGMRGRLVDQNVVIRTSQVEDGKGPDATFSPIYRVQNSEDYTTSKMKTSILTNKGFPQVMRTDATLRETKETETIWGLKPTNTIRQRPAQISHLSAEPALPSLPTSSQSIPWNEEQSESSTGHTPQLAMFSNDTLSIFYAEPQSAYKASTDKDKHAKGIATIIRSVQLSLITESNFAPGRYSQKPRTAASIDGDLKSDFDLIDWQASRHGKVDVGHKCDMNSTVCTANASIEADVNIGLLGAPSDASTAAAGNPSVEDINTPAIEDSYSTTSIFVKVHNEFTAASMPVESAKPQKTGHVESAIHMSHTRSKNSIFLPQPTSQPSGLQHSIAAQAPPAIRQTLVLLLTLFVFFN